MSAERALTRAAEHSLPLVAERSLTLAAKCFAAAKPRFAGAKGAA